MNGLEGFIVGMLCGIILTYFFFINYAKLMNSADKEMYKNLARAKWKKKD